MNLRPLNVNESPRRGLAEVDAAGRSSGAKGVALNWLKWFERGGEKLGAPTSPAKTSPALPLGGRNKSR